MYSKGFREKMRQVSRLAQNSGESEGLAIGDWLESMLEEEDMEDELVLEGLNGIIKWAEHAKRDLSAKVGK